jgi:hypothetical protein
VYVRLDAGNSLKVPLHANHSTAGRGALRRMSETAAGRALVSYLLAVCEAYAMYVCGVAVCAAPCSATALGDAVRRAVTLWALVSAAEDPPRLAPAATAAIGGPVIVASPPGSRAWQQ